jgi:hypothetical protein
VPSDPPDFLEQMWLVTREQSALHAVPEGSLDLLGCRAPVRHGPWPAERCAAVLRAWHAVGWIELEAPSAPASEGSVLAAAAARLLLASPGLRSRELPEGQVCLRPSDAGLAHTAEEWYAVARASCADAPPGSA